MLINPIINKLQQLRLHTMAKGVKEQLEQPVMTELSFEDRLGLLVDMEESKVTAIGLPGGH